MSQCSIVAILHLEMSSLIGVAVPQRHVNGGSGALARPPTVVYAYVAEGGGVDAADILAHRPDDPDCHRHGWPGLTASGWSATRRGQQAPCKRGIECVPGRRAGRAHAAYGLFGPRGGSAAVRITPARQAELLHPVLNGSR